MKRLGLILAIVMFLYLPGCCRSCTPRPCYPQSGCCNPCGQPTATYAPPQQQVIAAPTCCQ